MPFFKRDGENLLQAPNFVSGPGFELVAEQKDTYTFPVEGWYWFDTLDAALTATVLKSTGNVEVSRRQAELAMLQYGVLDTVEAVVAQQSREVQISYNRATVFKRDDTMLNAVCTQVLQWDPAQIDAMFALAASFPS